MEIIHPTPLNRKEAIHEILRGRDFTCQLRKLLLSTYESGGSSSSAEDLVAKILKSFTHTLSILNSNNANYSEVSQCLDAPKSEISSGDSTSCDKIISSSTKDDRRGCSYKRRKTITLSESWANESETLVDDGHQWRKYGQKTILKSDFPRHYYRCTHKNDQKCEATKQVQMIQSHPKPMYRTTYYSRHTCTNPMNYFFLDPPPSNDDVHLISFSNNNNTAGTSSIKGEQHDSMMISSTPFLASFPTSSPPSSSTSAAAAAEIVPLKQESSVDVGRQGGGSTQTENQSDVDDDDDYYQSETSYMRMLMDPPTVDHGWFSELS